MRRNVVQLFTSHRRLGTLLAVSTVTVAYLYAEKFKPQCGQQELPFDPLRFSRWTLVAKQQISDTNSLFRLTPLSTTTVASSNDDNGSIYDKLFKRGTWSVQIKQPQLQIAREYTPLPPLPSHTQSSPYDPSLEFLIKRDGEVSKYIHRLDEQSEIELRGPKAEYIHSNQPIDEVIFLAGGTGIAPALQLAYGIHLRSRDHLPNVSIQARQEPKDNDNGKADDTAPRSNGSVRNTSQEMGNDNGGHTRISILWANRFRKDCMGGISDITFTPPPSSLQSTFVRNIQHYILQPLTSAFTSEKSSDQPRLGNQRDDREGEVGSTNPIVQRIEGLKHFNTLFPQPEQAGGADRYAERVGRGMDENNDTISIQRDKVDQGRENKVVMETAYFVDEQGSYITSSHIQSLISRSSTYDSSHGKKIIFICGPDGFLEYFLGPKHLWSKECHNTAIKADHALIQGENGGVLGRLATNETLKGWEIVRL